MGWPHLLAFLIGAGLTVQIGMNAAVSRAVGSPLLASIVNFVVGLCALAVVTLASGVRPASGGFGQVPAWAWFGGLFGAAYVAAVTLLGPRIGALALLALVLLGQTVASFVVDQFGILGFNQNPVTPSRLLGAVLLVAGVLLIARR